jgi:ATP-dependent RNA helicase DDX55/SPB4
MNFQPFYRKILELGSSAFVSLIEAYNRHDCQIVCKVKGMIDIILFDFLSSNLDLNIAGLANAFGLLRMPRIRELNGRKDLSEFRPRMDVKTGEIKFKDPKMEAKRQMKIQGGSKQIKEENATNEMEVEEEEEEIKQPKKNKRKLSEWEQLQREEHMIKKFKKGKLSKEQLNDGLDQF